VKILEKDQIKDVTDMERITREINVLKLLYHPNVIKLYEVIDTQKHIYIVTEYADGGELFVCLLFVNFILDRIISFIMGV
jgi:5'-AMP-activated protein kinase catalytic alpha subunit